MRIHLALLEDLCRLHEKRRALVVGEEPQVDNDGTVGWDAQGCPANYNLPGIEHVGLEEVQVYAIRQRVDAAGTAVEIALQ
jgi:hypothetical protein